MSVPHVHTTCACCMTAPEDRGQPTVKCHPTWRPIYGQVVHCRLGRLLDSNPGLPFHYLVSLPMSHHCSLIKLKHPQKNINYFSHLMKPYPPSSLSPSSKHGFLKYCSPHVPADCPCCMSTLHVQASCQRCTSLMLVHSARRC